MFIDVEPQQILLQAEKVKQYQLLYQKNWQKMNGNVKELTIFWQGQEASHFINAWQQLNSASSSIQSFNQALVKYANQLNRIGNLYLEAQKQAQLSAKRL